MDQDGLGRHLLPIPFHDPFGTEVHERRGTGTHIVVVTGGGKYRTTAFRILWSN